jgi:hypothetical protein
MPPSNDVLEHLIRAQSKASVLLLASEHHIEVLVAPTEDDLVLFW